MFPFKLLVPILGATALATAVAQGGGSASPAEATNVILVPDAGETAHAPAGHLPGGTLGEALAPPVMLGGGGKDLYIQQAKFHPQFAADVPKAAATLMAATQRPIAEAGLIVEAASTAGVSN